MENRFYLNHKDNLLDVSNHLDFSDRPSPLALLDLLSLLNYHVFLDLQVLQVLFGFHDHQILSVLFVLLFLQALWVQRVH